MHVLVTGGAGYIGSMLVPALLDRGWRVTVLDSFGAGDAVVELVARASAAQLVVFPTTNSGYGAAGGDIACTEDTPQRPISLYGRTKVDAEAAVLASGGNLSFRLATVFGMAPRMRLDLLVNDFVWRAVHDRALVLFEARFRRNFIHVRDVVKAMLHGIDNAAAMRGRAYNVGLSDANLSKAQLCERIARQVPGFVWMEAAVGRDPDQRDYIVSSARLEATGWSAEHGLDRGIAELIKGFGMLGRARFANV